MKLNIRTYEQKSHWERSGLKTEEPCTDGEILLECKHAVSGKILQGN